MGLFDALLQPPLPRLRDEAILLRLPKRSDFADWQRLRVASRQFLAPWEPLWSADDLSRKAFRGRLARYRAEAHERAGYTFFMFDAAGKVLYGGITVGQIRRGVAQSCTLGYWMGEAHAGGGLMHRAIELLKPFIFDVEGLHRVEAACLPSNQRSIRLLEKAGFRREGYLRDYLKIAGRWEDHYLYSLLADDWRSVSAAGRPLRRTASP